MTVRVCAEPGCPMLTRSTRCRDHERARDKARGTTTERGYGSTHQRIRAHLQRRMDAGETFTCWRPGCERPIDPTDWHLGHDDHDRTLYRGPECVPCNTATSSRR